MHFMTRTIATVKEKRWTIVILSFDMSQFLDAFSLQFTLHPLCTFTAIGDEPVTRNCFSLYMRSVAHSNRIYSVVLLSFSLRAVKYLIDVCNTKSGGSRCYITVNRYFNYEI
jgi:hypothetical protein